MKFPFILGWFLLMAAPCFCQTADVFVKGDPYQCWLDVRDVVHRYGTATGEEEASRIIHAGRFRTMAGGMSLSVQALPEKNKKGEEGCQIYVAVEGTLGLESRGRAVNSLRDNTSTANFIAAEVRSREKAREKKAKEK